MSCCLCIRIAADAILQTAESVVAALDKAEEEQNAAEQAIQDAESDISMATDDLDAVR